MEQRKDKGNERFLQVHFIDITGDHNVFDFSGHVDVSRPIRL